jgi:hypothetical protein
VEVKWGKVKKKAAIMDPEVIDLSRSPEVRPRVLPHLKVKLRV